MENNLNNMIFSASEKKADIAAREARPNYEQETKLEIMSTLLHINGSMKEFAEDIEDRMHKAFKSKAGKKYGLSEVEIEMRKLQKDDYSKHKAGLADTKQLISASYNSRFLRKHLAWHNFISYLS